MGSQEIEEMSTGMPVYPLVCSLSCFEPLYLRDLIRKDVYYII